MRSRLFETVVHLIEQGMTPDEIVVELEGTPGPLGLTGEFFADHRKILLTLIRGIGWAVDDNQTLCRFPVDQATVGSVASES